MHKLIRTLIISLLVIIVVSDTIKAGSKRRRGTAGAQELLIPFGSRGVAMSGSYVAGLSGIEAVLWNPAGVAAMDGRGQTMFSFGNWIADIDLTFAGVASKFGSNYFGFTLQSLGFGDIPVTTEEFTDGTGEYFSPTFITLGFLFSRKMTDRIFFGTNLKLVYEGIMRENATGFVVDAGVQYYLKNPGFKIGASLRNLGLNMIFDGPDLEDHYPPADTEPGTSNEPRRAQLQGFEMPTTLELGVAYGPINLGMGKLNLAASFLNNNFSFDEYRFGGELELMNVLFIRGGFSLAFDPEPYGLDFVEDSGDEEDDKTWESQTDEFIWGPSFGFGINTKSFTNTNLMIDYAYRYAEIFSGVQWITVSMGF